VFASAVESFAPSAAFVAKADLAAGAVVAKRPAGVERGTGAGAAAAAPPVSVAAAVAAPLSACAAAAAAAVAAAAVVTGSAFDRGPGLMLQLEQDGLQQHCHLLSWYLEQKL